MGRIHLWQEELDERGGEITSSATVEHPDGRRERLWYRVGSAHRRSLTGLADPFVIGTLFHVMNAARSAGGHSELFVHGQVSPSLIRNLDECQAAWTMWVPELYSRVSIGSEIEREPEDRLAGEAGVMCFSGGVDSAFTAFRHTRGREGRMARPLQAAVMVQGMDFRVDETELFLRAERRARIMLDSVGLELIRVTTNFREINSHWDHCHGSAVASCMAILSERFSFGLIAQTLTYANNSLSFEGVNPITDWLYSSDSFGLIPDGASATRLQKIYALRDWSEFLESVRVCWRHPTRKDENCCVCGKCVRTILQFRTVGLGLPPAFAKDVPDETINRMRFGPRELRLTYEPLLEEAKRRGISEPWVFALERTVKRSRRGLRLTQRPEWTRLPHRIWRKLQIMRLKARSDSAGEWDGEFL